MNALEIIDTVRGLNAELLVEHDKLVVRGSGERLSAELKQAIQDHKPEILAVLGVPTDRVLAQIINEIRPNLPAALASVPDSHLLKLINFSILHALSKGVREFGSGR